MSDHAKYAPSGASRWLNCPGSVGLEAELPDTSSHYADEGSCAHDLASQVLRARVNGDFTELGDPRNYIGRKIVSGEREFYVDEAMADFVDTYATSAMIYSRAPGAVREVEQRVHFGAQLGVGDNEAFGTVDFGVVIPDQGEIQVHDFKYGMGVKVFAEQNEQMMLYAIGYLNKYNFVGDFTNARLVIHQPRLDHEDEWLIDIADLLAFGDHARMVVGAIGGGFETAEGLHYSSSGALRPADKSCRFCKAKATCPALRAEVKALVAPGASADDFEDLTQLPDLKVVANDALGAAMDKVGLIEDFCKAVRAEVERRLHAEQDVDSPAGGYKLGDGKRGNRAWKSEEEVEAALKKMRLKADQMYTFKLKGPAPIEKLLAKDFPRRWAKIKAMYWQPDGKPSVMLKSDPRPAITKQVVLDAFEDVSDGSDLV